MRFRAPYLIGTLALTVLALIVYGWMTIFGWHRPYINWAPWDLAEYLVKNGRPANECWDLIWFEIMSPTADEALQNAQTFVESRLQNNKNLMKPQMDTD